MNDQTVLAVNKTQQAHCGKIRESKKKLKITNCIIMCRCTVIKTKLAERVCCIALR